MSLFRPLAIYKDGWRHHDITPLVCKFLFRHFQHHLDLSDSILGCVGAQWLTDWLIDWLFEFTLPNCSHVHNSNETKLDKITYLMTTFIYDLGQQKNWPVSKGMNSVLLPLSHFESSFDCVTVPAGQTIECRFWGTYTLAFLNQKIHPQSMILTQTAPACITANRQNYSNKVKFERQKEKLKQ